MELRAVLDEVLNSDLYQMVFSAVRGPAPEQTWPEELLQVSRALFLSQAAKCKVRPILLQERLLFQVTSYVGTKVYHENLTKEQLILLTDTLLSGQFGQLALETALGHVNVLVSKKGKRTIKRKKVGPSAPEKQPKSETAERLSHNRTKKYLLPENTVVPFLVDLGVQTKEGAVVRSRYDKFRQINRFLELIEDILPELPKDKTVRILDFGCGKSYLTFAAYYYLHEVSGYNLHVTGLDLKEDVIDHCNRLSEKYGYDGLRFEKGDIQHFDQESAVDMVITLHACDLATDYALEKAVKWGAKVIMSVPCCQHELNRQMKNAMLAPVLGYGVIKERTAALLTDAIRAQVLEVCGYETQILEFIDMEHTPKNLMIRGIRKRTGASMNQARKVQKIKGICDFYQVNPTIVKLLIESANEWKNNDE